MLRPGGVLLAAFLNPLFFFFDHEAARAGAPFVVIHPLLDSDPTDPDPPPASAGGKAASPR